MKSNTYCVIMAGGIGSRFWPVSRKNMPKQFLDILGVGKSFIRMTYERMLPVVPTENFLVVTNSAYKDLVMQQIPELDESQVLSEPIGRNTAPCIAYAAFHISAMNPAAEMVVTPADHLILDQAEFVRSIEQSLEFVRQNNVLMTIGIKPNRPDTGFGYIQMSKHPDPTGNIDKVKTFTEKPNLEMAKVFLKSGEFLWNAGIFIWKAAAIKDEIRKHLPDTYELFRSVEADFCTPREAKSIARVYSECRSISIDFGVMEKADNVYVRISDFGWSDIGTWGSLYQYSDKDDKGNAVSGDAALYDTHNCVVKVPEGRLAVIDGLRDYLVINTDDVLMVCRRDNEQNVKMFIDDLKYKEKEEFI